MQELEKILEEIDIKIAGSMGKKREGLLEAEEIIRKHMNDGWIPVEERLPKAGEHVLVSFRSAGFLPATAIISENGRWSMLQGAKGFNDVTEDVIAWRPLPEPYCPKKESRKIAVNAWNRRIFDKEKVIEELDKLTGEECTLHECGIRSERCKPCIAKKAIEIVEKGGIE